MTTPCYLYSSPSGIELIEGDKMPGKPDFRGDFFLHYGPQKEYEAALQYAKDSGIPVQDQERAKAMIKSHLKEKNPGLPAVMFEETIYGPFNISYKVRYRTDKGTPIRGKMYLTEGGQPPQDLKEGIPYAILYDDTPATKGNLLPCPFCGSQPEWINEALADSHFYIKCPNCHIVMKEDRRDKVIGMWNNRFTITRKQ